MWRRECCPLAEPLLLAISAAPALGHALGVAGNAGADETPATLLACYRCASVAAAKLEKLDQICRGKPTSVEMANRLKCILSGVHPTSSAAASAPWPVATARAAAPPGGAHLLGNEA